MPGALILAIPFSLLGNSAYQNVFWLFMFLRAVERHIHNKHAATLLFWLVLLSPAALGEFLTGGDYLANSLYVMLFAQGLVLASRNVEHRVIKRMLAIGLGIALSSRVNFVFILPIVVSAISRLENLRAGVGYGTLAALSFLAVTLPFYLYDPVAFSPLHVAHNLEQMNSTAGRADAVIVTITTLAAVVLAIRRPHAQLRVFLADCALVLAIPVVAETIVGSLVAGRIDLSVTGYGLSFLFFGLLSWALHPSQRAFIGETATE
jgi:hypothetical protein